MRLRWRHQFFGQDRVFPRFEFRKDAPGGYALRLLAVLGGLAFAAFAAPVLVPVAAAAVLYYIFAPVKRRLNRHGIRPLPTAIGILAALLLLLMAGVTMLAAPVSTWIEQAPTMVLKVEQRVGSILGSVEKVREATERIQRMTKNGDRQVPAEVAIKPRGVVERIFGGFSDFVIGVGATLILLFYLLVRAAPPERPLIGLIGGFATRRRAYRAVRQAEHDLADYVRTIALINLCLGLVLAGWFYAIGLPGAGVLGAVAGLFNFVPLLGGIASVALTAIIGMASFDTLGYALLAPGGTALVHILEANFITPSILGRRLTLDPFLTILALLLGAWLWGIGGALLAVPMLLFTAAAWRAYLGIKQPQAEAATAKPSPVAATNATITPPMGAA